MKTSYLHVLSFVALSVLILSGCANSTVETPGTPVATTSTPVSNITHGHGLAVDAQDPTKLYIATHEGLLLLLNDKDLTRIGQSKDDFMGFSPHPTESKTFFSSGHPALGGNIGMQRSTDGGMTWSKVSNGLNGPVDFHAMTVSSANPAIIYGWYRGQLQQSLDGGNTWGYLQTTPGSIVSLTTDPTDEAKAFATTTTGIMKTTDKGQTWAPLSKELKGVVTALAVHPGKALEMLSFSEDKGLARSKDGGLTWTASAQGVEDKIVLFIAYSRQAPGTVYLLTKENTIYKSVDAGTNWEKVR